MHHSARSKHKLEDAEGAFDLTVLTPVLPRAVVLFAAGAGGMPERHMPLLEVVSATLALDFVSNLAMLGLGILGWRSFAVRQPVTPVA